MAAAVAVATCVSFFFSCRFSLPLSLTLSFLAVFYRIHRPIWRRPSAVGGSGWRPAVTRKWPEKYKKNNFVKKKRKSDRRAVDSTKQRQNKNFDGGFLRLFSSTNEGRTDYRMIWFLYFDYRIIFVSVFAEDLFRKPSRVFICDFPISPNLLEMSSGNAVYVVLRAEFFFWKNKSYSNTMVCFLFLSWIPNFYTIFEIIVTSYFVTFVGCSFFPGIYFRFSFF